MRATLSERQHHFNTHWATIARRRPDLDTFAHAIRQRDDTALGACITMLHHGDRDAGVAAMWGLLDRLGGEVFTRDRHTTDDTMTDIISTMYLVLLDLDPTLTQLSNRAISRTRRRWQRSSRTTATLAVTPLADNHPIDIAGGRRHPDPTADQALARVDLNDVTNRARCLVRTGNTSPDTWHTILSNAIDGLTPPPTTLTPSGLRTAIWRTRQRLTTTYDTAA